jgi:hypothetical protein
MRVSKGASDSLSQRERVWAKPTGEGLPAVALRAGARAAAVSNVAYGGGPSSARFAGTFSLREKGAPGRRLRFP